MTITPAATHPGTYHMLYHVPAGWRKFVYDAGNRVFEIMDDLTLRPCGSLVGLADKCSISGVAFHPCKELAAFVTDNGMAVSDFHGNRLWEYHKKVAALLFSRDGDELWIAEIIDSNTLFISVVDVESGMENSANTMEDPLYESHLSLAHGPDCVLLQLAAGQDGIELWRLDDRESALRREVVFPHHCHIMPAFRPDGRRLLTLEKDEGLFYSYTWPEAELLAKQQDFAFDDEELCNNYCIIYLQNGLAIVQSASDRFYLLDLDKMERLEELVIEGFAPVPTNVIYPRLKDDESLCSPIVLFERLGDLLVAKTDERWKEQAMVLLREDEVIRQIRR